ncbi:MAG: tetraacyldisaccharide 4'-kinase [Legionellaceae bacterium]|nr:tetraacyldisaccharide 4'-kinase [Legionellaceae bacterium]
MDKSLLELLVCPICKGKLSYHETELRCKVDRLAYPIKDDIPVMLANKARKLTAEELEGK